MVADTHIQEDAKTKSVSLKKHGIPFDSARWIEHCTAVAPDLSTDKLERLEEVLTELGIETSSSVLNALHGVIEDIAMVAARDSALSFIRILLGAMGTPRITPMTCLLLERELGLNSASLEDIASHVGVSKQAVSSRLKRFRSSIKALAAVGGGATPDIMPDRFLRLDFRRYFPRHPGGGRGTSEPRVFERAKKIEG